VHEVSLIRGIVAASLEAADRHAATRVVGVSVVLGELSHISDEAMRFNFEVLSRGTAAEGAEVNITREPGVMACWDCGASNPAGPRRVCPSCRSVRVEITGGDQCYLESIDVDEEDDH
jgi:hydrogenase nickel incorporation protein HypA/HybF